MLQKGYGVHCNMQLVQVVFGVVHTIDMQERLLQCKPQCPLANKMPLLE